MALEFNGASGRAQEQSLEARPDSFGRESQGLFKGTQP
jgi:hypothetical protein